MTFNVKGYQCFRTIRGGDRRKCGIITPIKSNISGSSAGPDPHTVTDKTLEREILLVNYYCRNNGNVELHNILVRDRNFNIMRDFNSHS